MASKKRSGASLSGLQRAKTSLKAQITKMNQAKRDAQRAAKLKREVDTLRNKVKRAKSSRGSRKRK